MLQCVFGKNSVGSQFISPATNVIISILHRVLAQVSCEVQQPKSSRPSEGMLNINIELTPLAAAHFEVGRFSETQVQLNRILEKCLKDSKAVDLESLCIKVNEKVFAKKRQYHNSSSLFLLSGMVVQGRCKCFELRG